MALASESPGAALLSGAEDIKRSLAEFDWAGWLDWRESYLATGVVRIWTEGTAAFLSKVQPFELRPGEVTSSLLFYLAVVLLLWGLTAQPRQ